LIQRSLDRDAGGSSAPDLLATADWREVHSSLTRLESQFQALDRTEAFDAATAPNRARQAFATGDARLLVYCGAGCVHPSATEEDIARLGHRPLPGAFDLITGPWDIDAMHAARDYAAAWNSTILALEREQTAP
jgi:hypothetical protein